MEAEREPEVGAGAPVSDAIPVPAGGGDQEGRREMVEHPAKMLRIGGMIRELLEEMRRANLDQEGRRRAREVYERSVVELKEAVSGDLRTELERISFPFRSEIPTQSELRISQAQLVGWFEGLFHSMQAVLFGQRPPPMMPPFPGMPAQPGPGGPPPGERPSTGQYL
ncbi:MAG: proteasome activator [Actinomycetota bacterium]